MKITVHLNFGKKDSYRALSDVENSGTFHSL